MDVETASERNRGPTAFDHLEFDYVRIRAGAICCARVAWATGTRWQRTKTVALVAALILLAALSVRYMYVRYCCWEQEKTVLEIMKKHDPTIACRARDDGCSKDKQVRQLVGGGFFYYNTNDPWSDDDPNTYVYHVVVRPRSGYINLFLWADDTIRDARDLELHRVLMKHYSEVEEARYWSYADAYFRMPASPKWPW